MGGGRVSAVGFVLWVVVMTRCLLLWGAWGQAGGDAAARQVTASPALAPQSAETTQPCFLCGRGATQSNKVKAGKVMELRELWQQAGDLYARVADAMCCPPGAFDHTHCRSFLRTLQQAHGKDGDSESMSLDVMARCYPLAQLREFLDPHSDHKSHRRCRGGLLSFLRFVAHLASGGAAVKEIVDRVTKAPGKQVRRSGAGGELALAGGLRAGLK